MTTEDERPTVWTCKSTTVGSAIGTISCKKIMMMGAVSDGSIRLVLIMKDSIRCSDSYTWSSADLVIMTR